MVECERIEHEDVEGLRVGRFPFNASTTCILYRLGSTVVDTGPSNQWATVRRFLAERAVERIVLTHHHEDHSGNAGPIRREMDAEVYAPATGVRMLSEGFTLRTYQRIVWGKPSRLESEPMPESIQLNGGTLRAIPTPGHSPDMTCYLDTQRGRLFTGDLYIASRPRYARADEDLLQEIESLRRILQCDFETVFCAHRGILRAGKKDLARKLDYLVSLCGEVQYLQQQGRSTREIARMLLGREGAMSWLTGFHFAKRNLVAACLKANAAQQAKS